MNIITYCVAAVVATFAALYLKQVRPDFALLVTLGTVIFIFSGVVPAICLLVEDIKNFASEGNIAQGFIEPILKIIGIAYITQIAADICADAGEKALSNHVETVGKITIAMISLPIVENVFSLILGMVD